MMKLIFLFNVLSVLMYYFIIIDFIKPMLLICFNNVLLKGLIKMLFYLLLKNIFI